MNPGLIILHGNAVEDLRSVMFDWLQSTPLPALAQEEILVQSNGMAQWLRLGLAQERSIGIAALLRFSMPSRFFWQAYRAVLGEAQVPRASALDKVALTWRLYAILAHPPTDGALSHLSAYMLHGPDSPRHRLGLAQRLADLFDQYQVYRADWLHAWAQGQDVLLDHQGQARALAEHDLWQPALWRRLLADLPDAQRGQDRACVHQNFIARLQALAEHPQSWAKSGLPSRLSVFGISALPRQMMEALQAIALHIPVLLVMQNPCRHYWADLIEGRELLRFSKHRHKQKPSLSKLSAQARYLNAQPLLAAWGKQGRDTVGLLYECEELDNARAVDVFVDVIDERATLLQNIQQSILDLEPPPERPQPHAPDASLSFHHCYSRLREVEVLQDYLLAALDDEPSLSMRDIVVMVPDVSVYTPLIDAVFGAVRWGDARYLPYHIADKSSRGEAPLLRAFEILLALSESRLSAADVVSLLEVEALAHRFNIDPNNISRLRRWIVESGIRFGIDAQHRQEYDLSPQWRANTWHFGVTRMLLGYAAGDVGPWQGVTPYANVQGLEAALAGQLAALIEQLQHWRTVLKQPATAEVWVERLQDLLSAFFSPESVQEQTLETHLRSAITQWHAEVVLGAADAQYLETQVVAETLLGRLDQAGLSQRFLAGSIQFCTLMPMRAVPFKIICLLGMNDADYPRSQVSADFDLMAADYRPGDRSRREDDRYLMLEALMAARSRFYISYVARSHRDNSVLAPSVLVGQLTDLIDACWSVDGQSMVAAISRDYPLQPFSPTLFNHDFQSYSQEWRSAWEPPSVDAAPGLALAELPEAVQLEDLRRFLRQPLATFYRRRLGVGVSMDDTLDVPDSESFEIDGLLRWQLHNQILTGAWRLPACQRASWIDDYITAQYTTGILPQGYAAKEIDNLASKVSKQLDFVDEFCHNNQLTPIHTPEVIKQSISTVQGDVHVEVQLSDAFSQDDTHYLISCLSQSTKKLKFKHLLTIYLQHLAANCQRATMSIIVLSDSDTIHWAPNPDRAYDIFSCIVAHYIQALNSPQPMRLDLAEDWRSAKFDEQKFSDAYGKLPLGEADAQEYRWGQALWPTFAAIKHAGFIELYRDLYQPLADLGR